MQNDQIYFIRPQNSALYGLGALFIEILKYTQYADANGMIPYVDWTGNATQYSDNEGDNAWSYFFSQPLKTIDIIDNNNIVLADETNLSTFEDDIRIRKSFCEENRKMANELFNQYYGFSEEVKLLVDSEGFIGEGTIGLLLRGTDYTKLRPQGHAIQPSFEEVVKVVDSYIEKNNTLKLFVVTEDYQIMEKCIKEYGDYLITTSLDNYIRDYPGKDLLACDIYSLSQLGTTPKERGMNYLKKLILLSKCEVFIAGDTCGSWLSYAISDSIKSIHIFDCGVY